jgi:hypothetical protein
MNSRSRKPIEACLIGVAYLLILAADTTALAQVNTVGQRRVLIDASKDGGLWWFPQGKTFDAGKEHQGKALADLMRDEGWEVTELPRGESITFETLQGFDVVIRPPAFFAYTENEAIAYRQSVAAGTRLILVGGSDRHDAVAAAFGLRFGEGSQFTSVQLWIPHPLTENIECCDLPWTAIITAPKEAVLLAWLGNGEANSLPALGYLAHGQGYVTFLGHPLISPHAARSFSGALLDSVQRHTLNDLKGLPVAGPVVAKALSGRPAPFLLEPAALATLPQPGTGEWHFDWEDVPAAQKYEIVVLGPSAAFPIVQTQTGASEHTVKRRRGSFIVEANLRGWSWRVRARFSNGEWGPWSRIRRFNVTPLNQ